MGQYYHPTLIDQEGTISWVYTHSYDNGLKLMEHGYIGNSVMNAVCGQIKDHPLRVAWIGDYSDDQNGDAYEAKLPRDTFLRVYDAVYGPDSDQHLIHPEPMAFDIESAGWYLVNHTQRQKLHDAVLEYFSAFDGFPGYEVVAAEQAFVSSLAGERFTGVIDLILRDQATGDYVLVDHKSSSLPSFRKTKTKMYRQLLLYAKHIADQYGVFPSRLCVNLFKEHSWAEQPYQPIDFIEAVSWAEASIRAMNARELPDWLELRPEQFYCTQLCDSKPLWNFFGTEKSPQSLTLQGFAGTPWNKFGILGPKSGHSI